jgi:glycosyltransferase involved in cell wall biosynthesis
MNIHAITIVRDEADILEQTLRAAARWCDFIYVYDNGSTDGSWEIVQRLADDLAPVVPFRRDDRPFTEPLRGVVFRQFRDRSAPGDWWCRLDTDEHYIDDPRVFLRKVPDRYGNVWSAHFNYYFTDEDLKRYEADPSAYDAAIPIQERLRYYRNNWSEVRFFRDDGTTRWREDRAWPDGLGRVYPVRIWLRHFQYRSPDQIKRRLARRAALMRRAQNYNFFHEIKTNWLRAVIDRDAAAQHVDRTLQPSWRDRIVPAEKLDYDAHDRHLVCRPDLMPPLPRFSREWMHYSRTGRMLKRMLDLLD